MSPRPHMTFTINGEHNHSNCKTPLLFQLKYLRIPKLLHHSMPSWEITEASCYKIVYALAVKDISTYHTANAYRHNFKDYTNPKIYYIERLCDSI